MLNLRVIFIPCLLCLSACTLLSPKAEYIPDNGVLKDAIVGMPYFSKISIVRGRVFGGVERKAGIIEPNDSGIFLRNCLLPSWMITENTRDTKDHNCVEVYGTPTKPGIININISSGMYGHMFAPASEFSKDYTLTVVNP
ncbi:hypothetical protein AB1E22_09340 [Buttiauxella gaviniae]|uniref:Lipoprotein n=1 Tax=Buttiauxella gaviniae TaxID=82990 RepID=A0ABV3NU11_9ENTR